MIHNIDTTHRHEGVLLLIKVPGTFFRYLFSALFSALFSVPFFRYLSSRFSDSLAAALPWLQATPAISYAGSNSTHAPCGGCRSFLTQRVLLRFFGIRMIMAFRALLGILVATLYIVDSTTVFAQQQQQQQQQQQLQVKMTSRKAGEVRTFGGSPELRFVWCPAGEFVMGVESERYFHVQLSEGFWMGQTEVTQGEWAAVTGTRPWTPAESPDPAKLFCVKDGPKYPAVHVSWLDAQAFCVKLTEQMHDTRQLPAYWHLQLPTEAQWEYACRAGGTHQTYPGLFEGNSLNVSDFAWMDSNAGNGVDDADQHPREVATKKPNIWNLYDMSGNVDEWVADASPQAAGRHFVGGKDPMVLTGSFRVVRGGSFLSPERNCRVSSGHSQHRLFVRNSTTGFRMAIVKTPPKR